MSGRVSGFGCLVFVMLSNPIISNRPDAKRSDKVDFQRDEMESNYNETTRAEFRILIELEMEYFRNVANNAKIISSSSIH
jgi:hypothetical protein